MRLSHTLICSLLVAAAPLAEAQLFENLRKSVNRFPVGDPDIHSLVTAEGPKAVISADFDADGTPEIAVGNADGTISLLTHAITPGENPIVLSTTHLQTGSQGLRQITTLDLNSDSFPDLAAAAPFDAKLYFLTNDGAGSFTTTSIDVPFSTRNFVFEDFDGDGDLDLVTAGREYGLQQYLQDPEGTFTLAASFETLRAFEIPADDDPQNYRRSSSPVYPLRTFTPPGKTLPALIATHSESESLHVYETDPSSGLLTSAGKITPAPLTSSLGFVHDIQIGAVSNISTGALPDLVMASRTSNTISVLRGRPEAPYFAEIPFLEFGVASGPRFLQLTDYDSDGYNEIFTVLREGDRALIFDNAGGVPQTDAPIKEFVLGSSPREFITPDLDLDGIPDIIAVNRFSQDASIILSTIAADPVTPLPFCTYPTDAEPADLALADLNADGRDDVIQLHRASGDISIRPALEGGALGQPTYFAMGIQPNQMRISDIDGDGILDVGTANLGQANVPGSFAYRLGNGDYTFGTLATFILPSPLERLFSITDADFDGDGILDKVLGYFDCRIQFFRGLEGGGFEEGKTHFFVNEARAMAPGDFDQDGDIDLVGAGVYGVLVVIENKGDLLTTDTLSRTEYRIGKNGSNIRSLTAGHFDSDDDLDILVGVSSGLVLFKGQEGIRFAEGEPSILEDPNRAIIDAISARGQSTVVVSADFDGDGSIDTAAADTANSTLSIAVNNGERFITVIQALPVPSAQYIATGDIDGDGQPDLAGTGSELWIALSGPGTPPDPATNDLPIRPTISTPVINEILARNNSVPVGAASGKRSDMVELYNGASTTIDLEGWTLRLEKPDADSTSSSDFSIPENTILPPGGRAVIVYSSKRRDPFHTGFKLPGSGGTLSLIDPAATEVDRVTYPAQPNDISYARYSDGLASFVFNPFPDPGRTNLANGAREPDIGRPIIDPATLAPNTPLHFSIEAEDDIGIFSLTLAVRRLDLAPDDTNRDFRVTLFDDGLHADGAMGDGVFGGTLEPGLPTGATIEFFVEATSLDGSAETSPGPARFTLPGRPLEGYSLGFPSSDIPGYGFQISEVVSAPGGNFPASDGTLADWIELRHTGTNPTTLDDIMLSQRLFSKDQDDSAPVFSPSVSAPVVVGDATLVAISDPDSTLPEELSFPFSISKDGETIFLTTPHEGTGATLVLDTFEVPPLETGQSASRIGTRENSLIRIGTPTPASGNLTEDIYLAPFTSPNFRLFYRTDQSATTILESSLDGQTWSETERSTNTAFEQEYTQEITPGTRLFRTRTTN